MRSFVELGPWRAVHWWLTAVTVVSAGWVMFGGQHRRQIADRAVGWLIWHWVTGGRLEPRRGFPELDDPRTWRARAARRLIVGAARTAVLVALVAGEYSRSGAPHGDRLPTVAAAGTVGAALIAAATLAIVYVAVRVAHYLQWVRPLHRAVWKAAGWDETKRPGRYLKVPRDREHGVGRHWGRGRLRKDGVVVQVAPHFDWADRHCADIENIVRRKLDLGDVTVTPVPAGRHGYMQFRPKDPMPERAYFTDPAVRKVLADARASAPVIGLTRGGKQVAVDLDTESPHILLSAGTGGAKSSTMRAIAAQLMRHGAELTVIDIKRHSHQWARRLPGVTYARDLGEIHRVLCQLGEEGHRRNREWDDIDTADGEKGPVFRRHVILFEEMNATTAVLRQWWKNHKEPGDPPESPAVRSLAQILFMGRAVRIHVLAVAQMATARDMGGPELRENFATRILARHTERAWKMLVPECDFRPATRHPGRLQVCIGGVATETQGVFMTEPEARGFVAEKHGLLPSVAEDRTRVSLGKPLATVAIPAPNATELDMPAGVDPVTLVQASSDRGDGVVALRHDALRQAARRDPEFPASIGRRGKARLYAPMALQRWELNRPRATPVVPSSEGTEERNEVDEVDRMEATTRA